MSKHTTYRLSDDHHATLQALAASLHLWRRNQRDTGNVSALLEQLANVAADPELSPELTRLLHPARLELARARAAFNALDIQMEGMTESHPDYPTYCEAWGLAGRRMREAAGVWYRIYPPTETED